MGKSPAQRDKELRRNARLAAQAKAETRMLRRRQGFTFVMVGVLGVLLFAMVMGGYLVSGDDETADPTDSTLPTLPSTSLPATTFAPPVSVTLPAPAAAITGATPCPAADGSAPRTTTFAEPPPMCIDTTMNYHAVVHTSEGDMRFLLHDDNVPETVNNFVVLSRYHYYDGVPFYTILPRMMMLAGDATGDPEVGKGGPGYEIDDEIPDVGVLYTPGSLHTWTDEPDANGSRFLISTGEDAASLPNHTHFGTMLDGSETMRAIESKGSGASGEPTAEVIIESIEIIEEPDDDSDTSATTAA